MRGSGNHRGRGPGRRSGRGSGPGGGRSRSAGRDWGRLYRARDGMILGVCKGLARFLEAPVWLLRLGMIMLVVFTGVWPAVGAYLVAGFFLKPEPALEPESDDERQFYGSYASATDNTLKRLKDKFGKLDRRIRRMEDTVTSKEYDWNRRLNEE